MGQFFNKFYKKIEEDNIDLKRITPHGLRHTHATILISLSIPPNAIAERLGNSIEMIYKVYAHFYKELETQSVTVFGDFLASRAKLIK